jgi:D-alanine-D-alanine ligase
MSKKKVVLLQGGLSAEREVSLSTGKGFEQALKELGYPCQVIDCGDDLLEKLVAAKNIFKADVALLALHGKYAEDGIVQSLCEYIKLPYTGSGVMASAVGMDKIFTKQILINHDIPTPQYQALESHEIANFRLEIPYPVVVKPSREGSSVGVSIVKSENDLRPALDLAAKSDKYILVDKFIAGMELTIPVLDGKVLTPIEIVPKVDFYDYKNKYTAGRTDYYLPARLATKDLQRAKDYALKAFQILRMRCYGRIDFRVDSRGQSYIMEVNTLPGCTPTSLLPKSAKDCGISFNQLVEILVERAGLDYAGVK